MYTLLELESKTFGELKKIGSELNVLPAGDRRLRRNWIDAIAGVKPPLLALLEVSPAVEVQAQEPIIETVEASPGVEPVQDAPLESKFGRIVYPRPVQEAIEVQAQEPIVETVETSPGVDPFKPNCSECFDDGFVEDESGLIKLCQCSSEPTLSRQRTQRAIVPAAKNLPSSRSKTSTAHQLLELFKSSAHIIENSPGVKTEPKVSQSAIEPAVKNHLEEESDPNSLLTGIPLSDRFVARYSPPQPENIRFQVEADGQLSLVDFEVLTEPEPPDPDDFESLDAFREAIEHWDLEHPTSSSDHCSDHLSNSLHREPPNPDEFDSMFAFWAAYDAWDEASDDDSEPLEISLDSFCEWAPCPLDWYEPEVSEVSELSAVAKSSITSEFFIPTFGRWVDRSDRNDEPPDTGIFARLPKPKPPKSPPQASQPKSAQVRRASRNYPETIPKQFSCVAAGSSTQPARSPPGGEAI